MNNERMLKCLIKGVCLCTLLLSEATLAQTLPREQRPEWLRKEGLIMAGSCEPLTYRTR